MLQIREIHIEDIDKFWNKLSESFMPKYEMEDFPDFKKFVLNDIKNKTKYYGLFDNNDQLIGGFRLSKTITYFFVDENFDVKQQFAKEAVKMIKRDKKVVFTKQRFARLFLDMGFKIDHQRYVMILRPLKIHDIKIPKEYTINKFSSEDIDQVIKVITNAYQNTIDEKIMNTTDENSVRSLINETLKTDGSILTDYSFVLHFNNEPIGVILVDKYNAIPTILDIAIKKEHQGKGLGKTLIKTVINALHDKYDELLLFVTRGNTNAEHLYESLGFKHLSDDLVALIKNG